MVLIFLGVLIVSSFEYSAIQTAMTLSLMISDPNSPDLSPLAYQIWGQCWSTVTSCNRNQKQFPSFKKHFS